MDTIYNNMHYGLLHVWDIDSTMHYDEDASIYSLVINETPDLYELLLAASFTSSTDSPSGGHPSPEPILSQTSLPPPLDIQFSRSEATSAFVKLNLEPSFDQSLETQSTSAGPSVGLKQDTVSTGGDDRASLHLAPSFTPSTSPPPTTSEETPVTLNLCPVNDNSWIAEKPTKREAGPKRKAIVEVPKDLIRKLQQDKTYRQKKIKSIYDNSKYWSITFTDGKRCCVCNISEPSAPVCLTICTDSRGINRHFRAAQHMGDRRDYPCSHAEHPCKAAFNRSDALARHLKEVRHPRLTTRQKKASSAGSKGRKAGKTGGASANKY